ncbi:MAG: hypothetical protein JWN75_179 [Candidatus Saccharibacteria bacterium]|nr:hypothetical protein [Candidatus Saccharibacteria bacterium]
MLTINIVYAIMIANMSTKEASVPSVEQESVSTIHLKDIIPDSSKYEQSLQIPIKFRHALGRAALNETFESDLKPIGATIRDSREELLASEQPLLPFKSIDTSLIRKTSPRSERSDKQEKGPSRLSKIAGRIVVARTTVLKTTTIVARTATSVPVDLVKNTFARTHDTHVIPVVQLLTKTLPVTPVAERIIPNLTGELIDEPVEIFTHEDIPQSLSHISSVTPAGKLLIPYHDDLTGTLIDAPVEIPAEDTPTHEDIPLRQRRARGFLGRKAFRMMVGVPLIASIGILSGSTQAVQAEHQTEMATTASEAIPAGLEASAADGVQIVALPNQFPTHYIIASPAPEAAPASTDTSDSGSGQPPVSSGSDSGYGSSNATPEAAVANPAPHSEADSSSPTRTQTPAPVTKPKHNPSTESGNGYNGSAQGSKGSGNNKIPPSGHEVITFVTGGATDDSSQMFMKTLVDTGNVDPTKTKLIPTVSPKDMAPFAGGSLSTDESVAITKQVLMDNVRAELARNPNAEIHFQNFSEGNMGGNAVAQELLKEGINVKVTAYGNPESAIGMQNKSSAANSIVKPVMDNLGIVEIPNVPYTENIFDGDDMWATTAGDGGLETFLKLLKIPTNHRVVDTVHETPIQTFRIGTEIYKNYGTKLVAIPPNAVDVTGDPGPEFHKFRPDAVPNNIDVLAGQGGLPGPAALPNPDPSLVTLLTSDVQLPTPDAALPPPPASGFNESLTPSFFGEQPCVRPDGSQYFTPANAPC